MAYGIQAAKGGAKKMVRVVKVLSTDVPTVRVLNPLTPIEKLHK